MTDTGTKTKGKDETHSAFMLAAILVAELSLSTISYYLTSNGVILILTDLWHIAPPKAERSRSVQIVDF